MQRTCIHLFNELPQTLFEADSGRLIADSFVCCFKGEEEDQSPRVIAALQGIEIMPNPSGVTW